eukprot:gb/GEZN01009305.1/.p1 GENE.gb/GEZN01009305.1/~~gb/GEZN01009305.1/.p1  ORF type:complete len:332 (+),score=97.48 gb/GEZN01009305.1/:147-1142(+)
MVLNSKQVRKRTFAEKLKKLLHEYKNILICTIDFVGSNQMQEIRMALRGKGVVLIGKNTVVRKVMRDEMENNPKLESIMPLVVGNVGFVFTNGSNNEIRKIIQLNKKPAPAKVGVTATNDVVVPAGPTGLDPGQTGFFQTLEIATKIMRGSIEIINDVMLVKEGEKVNASHVGLLSKLKIRPFSYGMRVIHVYEDGFCFAAKVLDMAPSDLMSKWARGLRHVAALSLQLGMPTTASVPFSLKNAFRKLLAITMVTKATFPEAKDLSKMIAAAPAGGAAAAAKPAAKAPEPAKVEEKEEEEEDLDMGGLFGGDDDEGEEEGEEWDEEAGEEE